MKLYKTKCQKVIICVMMAGVFGEMMTLAQSVNIEPTNPIVLAGYSITLAANVTGGTGPFSYQWKYNGLDIQNDIITTVAGNGTQGYAGIGGPATNAQLYLPENIVFDQSGNLYVADFGSYRILKLDNSGYITVVAGNGHGGFSGDGGTATNATFYNPTGVAVDFAGNIFIADQYSQRIRMVDTNGVIHTIAGNTPLGQGGYSGDEGPAINASLNYPYDVACDTHGNLFISDTDNNRIRKVDTNGIITTVAGNGTNGYSGDGGAATNASLNDPTDIAVDGAGDLLISDYGNYRIRKVDVNGIITTVAGNGTNGYSGDGGAATNASLSNPFGVTWSTNGNFFIADYYNNRIREVDTNGLINTVAGNGVSRYSGDGNSAVAASLSAPQGVALDRLGNLYIADALNQRIRKVWYSGLPELTAGAPGNYTVTVSSSSGSITSSAVTLIVESSPLIYKTTLASNGNLTLNVLTAPDVISRLLVATNLNPPVTWQPIYTNLTGGAWQFVDTKVATSPVRFYRSITP